MKSAYTAKGNTNTHYKRHGLGRGLVPRNGSAPKAVTVKKVIPDRRFDFIGVEECLEFVVVQDNDS